MMVVQVSVGVCELRLARVAAVPSRGTWVQRVPGAEGGRPEPQGLGFTARRGRGVSQPVDRPPRYHLID